MTIAEEPDPAIADAPSAAPIVIQERLGGFTLVALFLAIGLIAFAYVWLTLRQRTNLALSSAPGLIESHTSIEHWLRYGYFASHGFLWPTADPKLLYRSETGAFMVSSFLLEKVWIGITGRFGWRLLAIHNDLVMLLTSALLALLAYRIARRFGLDSGHAFVLGVAVETVWFTFPSNLAVYWEMSAQAYCLFAAIGFLLIEERALDGRTRLLTTLQALSVFALTYVEYVAGTMFVASYLATVLILRGERPRKRLVVVLLLAWVCAFAIFGLQLSGARAERRRTGIKVVGSSFLYRSGLDGDSMFYGDHLDIAFGRDMLRRAPENAQFYFRWEWLFLAGVASVLVTLAAYVRRRAPPIAIVALFALVGMYLLYAAVFSQGVALHPYHYDALLVTPLILALFAMAPALVEAQTRRTGLFVLLALFGATWLSMFQLRIYALCYPAPQPPAVLAARALAGSKN